MLFQVNDLSARKARIPVWLRRGHEASQSKYYDDKLTTRQEWKFQALGWSAANGKKNGSAVRAATQRLAEQEGIKAESEAFLEAGDAVSRGWEHATRYPGKPLR